MNRPVVKGALAWTLLLIVPVVVVLLVGPSLISRLF
jgi:hypothetical protein